MIAGMLINTLGILFLGTAIRYRKDFEVYIILIINGLALVIVGNIICWSEAI